MATENVQNQQFDKLDIWELLEQAHRAKAAQVRSLDLVVVRHS